MQESEKSTKKKKEREKEKNNWISIFRQLHRFKTARKKNKNESQFITGI